MKQIDPPRYNKGLNFDLEIPPHFRYRNLSTEPKDYLLNVGPATCPVIISFGGQGRDPNTNEAMYGLVDTVSNIKGVTHLALRDNFCAWYFNGVRGISYNIKTTALWLHGMLMKLQPSSTTFIGSSGGGFAALLFGSMCRADTIIALTPQTLIEDGIECHAHGNIYLTYAALKQGYWGEDKYRDILNVAPMSKSVKLVLGTDDHVDRYHAYRLFSWRNDIEYIEIRGDHGTSIRDYRDSKRLHNLIESTLTFPRP